MLCFCLCRISCDVALASQCVRAVWVYFCFHWSLLAFKLGWRLPDGNGMLRGQLVCVWQMCALCHDTPLIVVTGSRAYVPACVHVSTVQRKMAVGGKNSVSFSLFPLFTMQRGLSRIGWEQRSSKLIIQCAGNVSKASAERQKQSKGLIQETLSDIPELM